ncbi:MAG: double zinc ribbon domain-containing protein [Pseudomonadota bacterium]|nr:double zinc ribbon domain-containing protein [Pseudomonadota bacterium]
MSNFLTSTFDSVRRSALDAARLALPQRCELCAAVSGTALVCNACSRDLPWLKSVCPVCALAASNAICGQCLSDPPAFDATIDAFSYAFPVDRLIHSFKYQGRLALAEWCAEAILARFERVRAVTLSRPHRLVALPLSLERQRERGYNQALEIARVLAARTRIALLRRGLTRVRATPPQSALPWAERAKNVRGAFACDVDLSGLTVAVVDDVMTTGASVAEVAKILKASGAARVENWIVARTPPPAER